MKESKPIVIAGGGPISIEFAAELTLEYGKKKQLQLVSLRRLENHSTSCRDVSARPSNPSQIASGAALSEESPVSVQKHALKGLTILGVDIKFKTRVVGTITLPTG